MKDVFDLLARIFIAIMFYYEALDSFLFYDNTKETMATYGFHWQQ